MNDLQRYLDIREISCQDIADATGFGYYSVQKTVKGIRRHPHIREAITNHLGLDYDKTWGLGSAVYLRRMIAVDTVRMAEEKATQAREAYLKKHRNDATITPNRKAVNV